MVAHEGTIENCVETDKKYDNDESICVNTKLNAKREGANRSRQPYASAHKSQFPLLNEI